MEIEFRTSRESDGSTAPFSVESENGANIDALAFASTRWREGVCEPLVVLTLDDRETGATLWVYLPTSLARRIGTALEEAEQEAGACNHRAAFVSR